MNTKRILVLLLALLMLGSVLASCQSSDSTTSATSTTSAPDASSTTTEESEEPYDVTITWFNTLSMIKPFEETDVGMEIKRQTGITLQVISGDMDKFQVLAAGGDLPDIVWLANDSGVLAQSLVDARQVIPLDDLLQTNGQNILRRNTRGIELLRDKITNGDGKSYFIPTETKELDLEVPQYNPWTGFYTRFDLYKAIGAPELNNEDDYLNMLRQMQDAYPTSPLGTKTYAISAWTDWGMWPYFFMYSPMYNWRGSDPFYWNIETYEVNASYMDPDSIFWKCIEFYFKANQLGIFDPEGLIMNWDQYSAKMQNGEIFTGPASEWGAPNREINGEEAGLFIIPGAFPAIHDVWSLEDKAGWGFANSRGISTNCEYPVRAMDLMNFLDSDDGSRLLISGVEGKHWDWVDGVPQPIGERLEALMGNSELEIKTTEEEGVSRLQYYNSGKWRCDDGFPNSVGGLELNRLRATSNPSVMAFAEFYGMAGSYPGEVYAKWVEDGIASSPTDYVRVGDVVPPSSEETGQLISMGTQFISSNLGNLILAEDKAAFDVEKARIIAELDTMGLQRATDELLANYQIAYDSLFD